MRPLKDEKHVPERKCILSGEHGARDDLIRLALSPDGEVLPDVRAKAPGRGAWIGVDRPALEAALAKGRLRGALARAFKGAPLSIPEDLGERIEAALRQIGARPARPRGPLGDAAHRLRADRECRAQGRGPPPPPRRRCGGGRQPQAGPGMAGRRRPAPRSGDSSRKGHIVIGARAPECGTYRNN